MTYFDRSYDLPGMSGSAALDMLMKLGAYDLVVVARQTDGLLIVPLCLASEDLEEQLKRVPDLLIEAAAAVNAARNEGRLP